MRMQLALSLAALALSSSPSFANVPNANMSTASSASGTLMIAPSGGPTLASLGLTITVTVRDASGTPISSYPMQDITLASSSSGGNITLCVGGSSATSNTDAAGRTTIEGAIFGGAWSDTGSAVRIAGLPLTSGDLAINIVSPDYDGNHMMNMADLGWFALYYLNDVYDIQGDLYPDGTEDLKDVGVFVEHFLQGSACP